MRYLPKAYAEPVMPARSYVPPPQAGSLPGPTQRPRRPDETCVSITLFQRSITFKVVGVDCDGEFIGAVYYWVGFYLEILLFSPNI